MLSESKKDFYERNQKYIKRNYYNKIAHKYSINPAYKILDLSEKSKNKQQSIIAETGKTNYKRQNYQHKQYVKRRGYLFSGLPTYSIEDTYHTMPNTRIDESAAPPKVSLPSEEAGMGGQEAQPYPRNRHGIKHNPPYPRNRQGSTSKIHSINKNKSDIDNGKMNIVEYYGKIHKPYQYSYTQRSRKIFRVIQNQKHIKPNIYSNEITSTYSKHYLLRWSGSATVLGDNTAEHTLIKTIPRPVETKYSSTGTKTPTNITKNITQERNRNTKRGIRNQDTITNRNIYRSIKRNIARNMHRHPNSSRYQYLQAQRARDLVNHNIFKQQYKNMDIKVATWNITTLAKLGQRQEIERYKKNNKIDIIGLQETKTRHNSQECRK